MSTEHLRSVVERARAAAGAAGELRPPRVGTPTVELPEAVRRAIDEDLGSGAYQRAAAAAVAGDPELTQH